MLKYNLLVISILFTLNVFGQLAADSLALKSYIEIEDKIFENPKDTILSSFYANYFLKKAKIEGNKKKEIRAYYFLSLVNSLKTLAYNDSILIYSDKYNIPKFKAPTYLSSGNFFYAQGEYIKALDNYLLAKKYVEPKNKMLVQIISNNIGNIKSIVGKYEEALLEYKNIFHFIIDNNFKTLYTKNYLNSIVSVSDSYLELNQLDSSRVYNKIGAKEANNYKSIHYTAKFMLLEAIRLNKILKYNASNDSLVKAKDIFFKYHDSTNLALTYLYLGKNKKKVNSQMFVKNLKLSLNLVEEKKIFLPAFLEIYSELYQYSKEIGKPRNELYYLEGLLHYSDSLNKINKFLFKKISEEYDMPNLIKEKENLILSLKKESYNNQSDMAYIYVTLFSLILILVYFGINQRILKRKFKSLIVVEDPLYEEKKLQKNKSKLSGVPEETIEIILNQLNNFEENNDFINNSITLNSLAQDFNTNSNYLSRVVNFQKEKNFSKYLSDIRISYAIKQLKTDQQLSNYTIKAIADEVGFGNAESFSKAFYAKTGIYPSYFIKQIKKASLNS